MYLEHLPKHPFGRSANSRRGVCLAHVGSRICSEGKQPPPAADQSKWCV
jgi:hypothetical protein